MLALIAVTPATAENWPQWRGPWGTGVAQEKSAPLAWSKEKNVRWRVALPGPGNSTPIVWNNQVFVTCAAEEGRQRGLYCFDRQTGREQWQRVVEFTGDEPTHSTNPACSGSPVTDGERVIAWHGSAGLYCYDLAGKELWKKDLGKFEHVWGVGSSPVLYKDLVILNAGPGLNVAIIALKKATGEEVWRKEFEGMKSTKLDEFRGSWSTPVVHREGERDVLLLPLPEKLRAVDPLTGEELWSCGGASKLFYTSALTSNDVVVVMCGYTGPAFAVRGGGEGDVTQSHRLWLHTVKNPQRVGSGVVVDGHVYILNEDGIAWCIDVVSGEVRWKERLGGGATWCSAVLVAGKIYFANTAGDTFIIEPNPQECRRLGKNSLGELMRASPAVSNGELFLRTYAALYCIHEPTDGEKPAATPEK
ncbi:MAG TPA: PQQ-binding-like beta-propeller repeat protein [Pirellulaceae bacterium]|nr:PQQ-binding-like beta-propeller repeat protein [Pirellulaceae bacterium]